MSPHLQRVRCGGGNISEFCQETAVVVGPGKKPVRARCLAVRTRQERLVRFGSRLGVRMQRIDRFGECAVPGQSRQLKAWDLRFGHCADLRERYSYARAVLTLPRLGLTKNRGSLRSPQAGHFHVHVFSAPSSITRSPIHTPQRGQAYAPLPGVSSLTPGPPSFFPPSCGSRKLNLRALGCSTTGFPIQHTWHARLLAER
jgi:hypothetical protein